MFGASKTNSASTGGGTDPYYEYVTMLLTGNGTNGAQNNTFLDSSTNAFTLTRNGNTTQGSFSPYGTLWSNYFDGSSYFTTGSTITTLGAGDFTIECWANFGATGSQALFGYGNSTSGGFFIRKENTRFNLGIEKLRKSNPNIAEQLEDYIYNN